jgi:RHS repeat-associated protein
MVDQNANTHNFEWEKRQMTHRELHSQDGGVWEWNYYYANDKLTEIQFPEANKQVFCYEEGTTPPDCNGGTWSEKLQWQGKCDVSLSDCPESISYEYWPDFTLKYKRYYSGTELRAQEAYSSDAHKRLTWVQVGDSGYVSKRAFDGSDNLKAISPLSNAAPDFCATNSTLCSWLTYDRADRLAQFDTHPDPDSSATANSSRTCFDYDRNGNVRRVAAGCDGTGGSCPINHSDAGVASCTDAWVDYEWDDFGNVVTVVSPWGGADAGTRGTNRYSYNALGKVWQMQTEEMRQGLMLENTYDPMGRLLYRTLASVPPGFIAKTFEFTYDTATCGEQANTSGRIASMWSSEGYVMYSYDPEGRVAAELRSQDPEVCDNANSNTLYSYNRNGGLTRIDYPHGRSVKYTIDIDNGTERPTSVAVTRWDGGEWSEPTTVIDSVAWEPYGPMRAYRLTASDKWVEYYRAGHLEADADDVGGSCASWDIESTYPLDGSGRLRGVFVSNGDSNPGTPPTPTGEIFKQMYRWKGDLLAKQWTCHRNGSGNIEVESFTYDNTQRLLSAAKSSNGASEAFEFAAPAGRRGNRTGVVANLPGVDGGCEQEYVQVSDYAWHQDLLQDVQWGGSYGGSTCNPSHPTTGKYTSTWDRDGQRAKLYDATSNYEVQYGWEGSAGFSEVLRSVAISGGSFYGGTYQYLYDAYARRHTKELPWSEQEHYYYDFGHQLLSEVGVDNVGAAADEYPIVDYVWLGGRPVMAIQAKFATNWTRAPDNTGTCTRNGRSSSCEGRFIVTDYLGKPVLVLDGSEDARTAGTASYAAGGYGNRVPAFVGSARNTASTESLGTLVAALPNSSGWDVRARLLLHRNSGSGTSYLQVGGGSPYYTASDAHVWTTAVTNSTGSFALSYHGDGSSYGIDAEAAEFEVKESGVDWWFPALRFPGHYFDEETEQNENWNRYMDPGTGRYLSPEPLLQNPQPYIGFARKGLSLPPYAYAGNNPTSAIDSDGRVWWIPLALAGLWLANDVTTTEPGAGFGPLVAGAGLGMNVPKVVRTVTGVRRITKIAKKSKLEKVCEAIEDEFKKKQPKSQEDGMEVIQKAVEREGLEPGISGGTGPNGEIILQNRGGVTTTVGQDGAITVSQGGQNILELIP